MLVWRKLNKKKYIDNFKKNLIFKFLLIISILTIFVFYSLVIIESDKVYNYYSKLKFTFSKSVEILNNKVSSNFIKIDHYDLMIKDENLKKLNFVRNFSINASESNDIKKLKEAYNLRKETWVNAKVAYNENIFDVKVRLKGQSIDHWSKNFSLKCKVKNNQAINGLSEFNIQLPKTRGYLNELIFHKFLEYNDLISLRFNFINLSINGGKKYIYNIEESFAKELLENNERREGLIFSINILEEEFSLDNINKNEANFLDIVQDKKDLISNPNFHQQEEYINKNLYEIFFENKKPSFLFDYNELSKILAISDFFGNRHFLALENLRFYFNPLSNLIEPIGYDNQKIKDLSSSGLLLNKEIFKNHENFVNNFISLSSGRYSLLKFFFKDNLFVNYYFKNLYKFSKIDYYHEFYNKNQKLIQNNELLLYKQYPGFYFAGQYQTKSNNIILGEFLNNYIYKFSLKNQNILYENINFISENLKVNNNLINIKFNTENLENPVVEFDIVNNNKLPLYFKSFEIDGIKISNSLNNVLIFPYNYDLGKNKFFININKNIFDKITKKNFKYINFEFEVPGLNNIINVKQINNLINNHDISFLKNNYNIEINNIEKEIIFNKNEYYFDQNIVIPKGYKVYFKKGSKIYLNNNAKLISYSPIFAEGTENDQVIFTSKYEGGGIAIIETQEQSYLNNVQFNSLSYNQTNKVVNNIPLFLGGVNFYKSDVLMKNIIFKNSNSEDALNIIRSEVDLENILFTNSSSDSLDLDFVSGVVKNINIENSKNDGIDISGSNLELKNIKIHSSGDKAISIGEKSTIFIENFYLEDAYIGIAAKDKSEVFLEKNILDKNILSIIKDVNYGIAVYKKKNAYGSAIVNIGEHYSTKTNLLFIDNTQDFFIEKNSKLNLGSKLITKKYDDVFRNLYPTLN